MYKIIGYKRLIPNMDEDLCIPNVALPPGGINEGFTPCQNMHTPSPQVSPQPFSKIVISYNKVNIIASPLKIVKYILCQSMNMRKCL